MPYPFIVCKNLLNRLRNNVLSCKKMNVYHSDGGDGEILSSSLNNNSEDNVFLSLCLKGRLTPEQIYSILLQREETKQAREETKRKELELEILKLEQENNKRKF